MNVGGYKVDRPKPEELISGERGRGGGVGRRTTLVT